MFEAALKEKFLKIFNVKKVTYDQPSDSQEQECIFVEIEESRNTIKDGRALARVTGNGVMFGNNAKLPFAFFSKHIAQADSDDTKDLFFFDFEKNTKRYQNIVQRSFSFIYFYDAQYDPDTGEITSIEFTEE